MEMKVLMIEGRPAEHPIHRDYAKLVNSDFLYVDHFLRYQGKTSNKIIVFTSWLLTAIYLLFNTRYNTYFCGGPCPPLIFLRKSNFFRKKKKIISLAANETLYFLKEGKYSGFTNKLYHSWYNETIDGLICIGNFQEALAKKVINNEKVIICKSFNALSDDFFEQNQDFKYNPNGQDLICIANGPSGFRTYYKGLDILFEFFQLFCKENNQSKLIIIGDWDEDVQQSLLSAVSPDTRKRVMFTGHQKSFIPFAKDVGICLHLSRGDSYPTSTLETLGLGIPTIVSELTGTAEIVEHICKDWVTPLNCTDIINRVKSFLQLSSEEKAALSSKAQKHLQNFRKADAENRFKICFDQILTKVAY